MKQGFLDPFFSQTDSSDVIRPSSVVLPNTSSLAVLFLKQPGEPALTDLCGEPLINNALSLSLPPSRSLPRSLSLSLSLSLPLSLGPGSGTSPGGTGPFARRQRQ